MTSLEIKAARGTVWSSYLDFGSNEKRIHDHRPTEVSYERRKMTDADRAAYFVPLPRFGEFEGLWQRIAMYLSNEGYGTFI
jgi:hypothetical protein